MKQPWIAKWGQGEPLDGGGQGDTLFVPSRANAKGVLKILRAQNKADSKARARMFQEVSNLRLLSSVGANVPRVLDENVSEIEDTSVELFFVMEFVTGETLATFVTARSGLPLEDSISISLALCKTLRFAIQQLIVHRDLKPENVIVRDLSHGDIVMLDFGISFHHGQGANLTEHGEPFQNSLIRLPERTGIGENKRDFRSDLTDVCAILYYCLTAQPPRNLKDSHDESPHKKFQPIFKSKTKDQLQLKVLNQFFDRGFALDIDNRFQSIDEIEGRIQEIVVPIAAESSESLLSITARSVELLRKKDTKTRFVELRTKISAGISHIERQIREYDKVVAQGDHFHMQQMDGGIRRSQNEGFSRVYLYQLKVLNSAHGFMLTVNYEFALDGAECVVRRSILDAMTPHKFEEVDVRIVARFGDQDEVPLAEICKDIEVAAGKCIDRITAQILS